MPRKRKTKDEMLRNRAVRFSDMQWEKLEDTALSLGITTAELIRQSAWINMMYTAIYQEHRSFAKSYEVVRAASQELHTARWLLNQIEAQIETDRQAAQTDKPKATASRNPKSGR